MHLAVSVSPTGVNGDQKTWLYQHFKRWVILGLNSAGLAPYATLQGGGWE